MDSRLDDRDRLSYSYSTFSSVRPRSSAFPSTGVVDSSGVPLGLGVRVVRMAMNWMTT